MSRPRGRLSEIFAVLLPLPRSLRWLLLASSLVGTSAMSHGAEEPVLTTAAAVRRLSPDEAAKQRPAILRGTLLLVTAPRNAVVLLVGEEGIYVELQQQVADGTYRLGDLLEVTGVTDAGDFAPIVRAREVKLLGPGVLAPPSPKTIAELNAGGYDAAWIEMSGIVRSCIPTPPDRMPVSRGGADRPDTVMPSRESWLVNFAQGDDKMEVQINGPVDPARLVDARVRLRGVVFNVHNANRQFVRANVQVADAAMIEVLAPPAADPFALPVQSIGDVLQFSPTGFSGHRVHVRGVVTAHKDGHTLWLREGGRGMQVASKQEGNLAPGDEVQVVGFPDHGGYTPSLSDAVFRKVRAGAAPAPQHLHAPEEISRHDANLVQIEAGLREVRTNVDGVVLVLDWRGLEVTAWLQRDVAEIPSAWQPGSGVRVTGICLAGLTNYRRPAGLWVADDLQLWLRSSSDVAVIRAAPWLTTRRALGLIIAVALVTLLALVVVAIFARRQIAQREDARKLAEVEFSAMLAERNRLAREIHDTLAQELNAVSMQLELAKNSAKSGTVEPVLPFLAAAHAIVRQSLAAARESIWDMRSHILERTDLAGALRTVAEQLRGGLDCQVRVAVQGRARRLAPTVENNLLRIGQEAVSNALKHACPEAIEISLTFEDARVRLVVADNGCGFDPQHGGDRGSHFGLQGMRERAQRMNAVLQVGPNPGGGTRVDVVVESPGAA